MAGVRVVITETVDFERYLAELPPELRAKVLPQALAAAAAPVIERARQLCPRGRRADGKKPLADTIGKVLRQYGDKHVEVIGPQYPAGAHGHLVEFGHRAVTPSGRDTGKRVPPHPFLRPAADETRGQQEAAILATLRAAVEG